MAFPVHGGLWHDKCGSGGAELERIVKALRQRNGTIDPAELDTVIAIVSGQRPKNEIEAMTICQMAVTHALTMRSFGNLNRSNEIQQRDSNALTVGRLTKRRGGEQRVVVEHVHIMRAHPSSKIKDNLMQRTTQARLSLQMAKRCGAKARSGRPCQSPVMNGRRLCRMHGGAHGSGAPSGEPNGITDTGSIRQKQLRIAKPYGLG
jgi:hypothetical protein